jgi:hypothetical protein
MTVCQHFPPHQRWRTCSRFGPHVRESALTPNGYLFVGCLHAGAPSFARASEHGHQADQSCVVCALRPAQTKAQRRNKSSQKVKLRRPQTRPGGERYHTSRLSERPGRRSATRYIPSSCISCISCIGHHIFEFLGHWLALRRYETSLLSSEPGYP